MKNYLFIIIIILLTTQIYSQTKSVKVLLDDGTTRHYQVGDITKLTFEDDACDGVRTVTYSGEIYGTVQIGTQCWLEQNLNVGTYILPSLEQTDNSIIEKYCLGNTNYTCPFLGGLYQWAEAVAYTNGATNTSSPITSFSGNIQGICPPGWHIPSDSEFKTLIDKTGSSGAELRSINQGRDSFPGTNSSGFSALLGGEISPDGSTGNWDLRANFQTISENVSDQTKAYRLDVWAGIGGGGSAVLDDFRSKEYAYSVRCLKD